MSQQLRIHGFQNVLNYLFFKKKVAININNFYFLRTNLYEGIYYVEVLAYVVNK